MFRDKLIAHSYTARVEKFTVDSILIDSMSGCPNYFSCIFFIYFKLIVFVPCIPLNIQKCFW